MTERATVFEAIQIGLETTPGTEVNAGKRLEAYSINAQRQGNIDAFRPEGLKFPTLATVGKEHTTASVDGILDYTNVVYPLAGLLAYGTANIVQQGTTSAYKWTFAVNAAAPDTVATYTVEKGSSVRAEQFEYGTFTGFGFSFNAADSQVAVNGEMIGSQLRDGITMTASPTTIDAIPASPKHATIKIAATEAGLSGASALTRVLGAEFSYTGKAGPVYTVGTADSFVATVEQAGEASGTLTLAANSDGMGYLTDVRAGTQKWLEIEFTGANISGAYDYQQTWTMPVQFTAYPPLEDQDGVVAVRYGYHTVAAGTASPLRVELITTVTAL